MDTPSAARRLTHVTLELTPTEVRALKRRTGKRTANAALKAWIANADAPRTAAQLRHALTQSSKEESTGKGRRFKSGREAARWLES